MKKTFLIIIPFFFVIAGVVGYFKISQKISTITFPTLPQVSLSEIIKISRFSLSKAPSKSLVGSISSMSGDIKFSDRLATESAILTNQLTEIQQGTALDTGDDGNISVKFTKDSSPAAELKLLPNTSVGIIQTLPANIVFYQTKGIAEYKKLLNLPVSIRILHLLIDNGGDIEVSLDKDYPIVTTKVLNESITVAYNNINNISRTWTAQKGEELIFNDTTRRVIIRPY